MINASGEIVTETQWKLETDGVNLLKVMSEPFVDEKVTTSNDIVEIISVLGIEAGMCRFCFTTPCWQFYIVVPFARVRALASECLAVLLTACASFHQRYSAESAQAGDPQGDFVRWFLRQLQVWWRFVPLICGTSPKAQTQERRYTMR